jgi:imidazole glycerol-phosphate synthase subunit HisH
MIVVIKYNAGNIASVQNTLYQLGYDCLITDDTSAIRDAEKVIFPGVGEAGTAMRYLRERKMDELIVSLKQPVLGICLGLQLMCKSSEEGNTTGLGIFDAVVKRFPSTNIVPHIGWNNIRPCAESPILHQIADTDDVYFVHSYYAECCAQTVGICDYILPFSAVMQKDNFFATQFHPEKSGKVGARILHNFLNL